MGQYLWKALRIAVVCGYALARVVVMALGPVLPALLRSIFLGYSQNMSAGGRGHNFPTVALFVAIPALELGVMIGLRAAWTRQGRTFWEMLHPLAKLSWVFVGLFVFLMLFVFGFY